MKLQDSMIQSRQQVPDRRAIDSAATNKQSGWFESFHFYRATYLCFAFISQMTWQCLLCTVQWAVARKVQAVQYCMVRWSSVSTVQSVLMYETLKSRAESSWSLTVQSWSLTVQGWRALDRVQSWRASQCKVGALQCIAVVSLKGVELSRVRVHAARAVWQLRAVQCSLPGRELPENMGAV